jgi:hypothetical protein
MVISEENAQLKSELRTLKDETTLDRALRLFKENAKLETELFASKYTFKKAIDQA